MAEYSINLIYDSGFPRFSRNCPNREWLAVQHYHGAARYKSSLLPVDGGGGADIIGVDVVNLYALLLCSLSISGHLSQFVEPQTIVSAESALERYGYSRGGHIP